MQNKTHCAYVPRPRRKQYIENVNGRQLEKVEKGLPHNAAVTQTLARAQIQLISTNFSNCSPKKKKREKEQRKKEPARTTCPVANKEKTKNSKESIEKLLPRCQRRHRHRNISRPSRPSSVSTVRPRLIYTLEISHE